jgi:hypothetical protein
MAHRDADAAGDFDDSTVHIERFIQRLCDAPGGDLGPVDGVQTFR